VNILEGSEIVNITKAVILQMQGLVKFFAVKSFLIPQANQQVRLGHMNVIVLILHTRFALHYYLATLKRFKWLIIGKELNHLK
jgi:hypothetical protein